MLWGVTHCAEKQCSDHFQFYYFGTSEGGDEFCTCLVELIQMFGKIIKLTSELYTDLQEINTRLRTNISQTKE